MPTQILTIEALARIHLVEPLPIYWGHQELNDITIMGIRDLWRDVVDLKQEHYLTVDRENVFLGPNSSQLSGVPNDVHKVYQIEPRDLSESGANRFLSFSPSDFNSPSFQSARGQGAIEPSNGVILYAVTNQGAPVNPPIILTAPQTTSQVLLSFSYVPTLGTLTRDSIVPIPGEADNALVAWTCAFARSKEREDRSPDPAWLSVYANEKSHLLQSLGLRQLQENSFVEALFESNW